MLLGGLILIQGVLFAQQNTFLIDGRITDADTADPLPCVSVVAETIDSQFVAGTSTDLHGRYGL